MSDHTNISWADASWNPVTGCTPVTEGCRHCYARRDWARLCGNPKSIYTGRRFSDVALHHERLDQPRRWTRPRVIFVNSMSDLFHEHLSDGAIDAVWDAMSAAPRHVYLILTKRGARMAKYVCARGGLPSHVWMGVSAHDQESFDEGIEHLSGVAGRRWISAEPLLEGIRLTGFLGLTHIADILSWLVVGGESGPGARVCEARWVRQLRDDSERCDVPFYFKQWGEYAPRMRESREVSVRVGRREAGCLIEGRAHHAWPDGARPFLEPDHVAIARARLGAWRRDRT